jgi:signal peptidase I
MADTPSTRDAQPSGHAIKETISSLIVAFIFAFVFRGFVVEAFVIPTGSMAPTLLGKHMRFQSPESGATWTVDPWTKDGAGNPRPTQGTASQPITATDPMTGAQIGAELPGDLGINVNTLSGDRIFVLKYLYSIYDPSRYDVVVFKYPGPTNNPVTVGQQENYIKRLIGLPGEEIALVDGDVFTRKAEGAAGSLTRSDWAASNWTIARKSERVQRDLWQPVFDSSYAPLDPERNLRTWFESPWRGLAPDGSTDPDWTIAASTSYTHASAAPTTLAWDTDIRPITDSYYYNEVGPGLRPKTTFAVSDVRLAMGVKPEQDGLKLAAVLEARGHQFRAEIEGDRVLIRMRPVAADGTPGEWRTLEDTTTTRTIKAGKVTNVEFWHVDQSVQVWIEGKRVANAEYDWSPSLRIEHTLDQPADELLRATTSTNPLANEFLYPQPKVRWELEGSPVMLHRVRLERDLFYRPDQYHTQPGQPRHARDSEPALGTHPSQPNILGPDQFFVCGDNSSNSLDGRLWDTPDPWVREQIDPTIGVVPRDLLIGKAFFVYFPSFHKEKKLPVPDVGRMRFIW